MIFFLSLVSMATNKTVPPWEYYQDKMTRQQRMQKDSKRFPSLAK